LILLKTEKGLQALKANTPHLINTTALVVLI